MDRKICCKGVGEGGGGGGLKMNQVAECSVGVCITAVI